MRGRSGWPGSRSPFRGDGWHRGEDGPGHAASFPGQSRARVLRENRRLQAQGAGDARELAIAGRRSRSTAGVVMSRSQAAGFSSRVRARHSGCLVLALSKLHRLACLLYGFWLRVLPAHGACLGVRRMPDAPAALSALPGLPAAITCSGGRFRWATRVGLMALTAQAPVRLPPPCRTRRSRASPSSMTASAPLLSRSACSARQAATSAASSRSGYRLAR